MRIWSRGLSCSKGSRFLTWRATHLNSGAPSLGKSAPHPHPHCSRFRVLNCRDQYTERKKNFDKPNACPTPLQGPQIQYGHRGPGTVILTFFLWEIIQKFFFLLKGFHILSTRKNNFCHPGGSQWAPGGLLAPFRAKTAYFETNSLAF